MNAYAREMSFVQSTQKTDSRYELRLGLPAFTTGYELTIKIKTTAEAPITKLTRLARLRRVRGKYATILPHSDEIIKERRLDALNED